MINIDIYILCYGYSIIRCFLVYISILKWYLRNNLFLLSNGCIIVFLLIIVYNYFILWCGLGIFIRSKDGR